MTNASNLQVIFDNGGGITVQSDTYAHNYDNPKQAADDVRELLAGADPSDWDGNEPESRITETSGYRVYDADSLTDASGDTGWRNIDEFLSSFRGVEDPATRRYKLIDGTSGESTEITAENIEQAREAAEAWTRECTWDNDETIWVSVRIVDMEEGEEDSTETITVTIAPPEPKCSESEHDWQAPFNLVGGIKENPGVWGHGGGVVMHEVCMNCGCERVKDTWAQNPETGEQGLKSVEYRPGKYTAEVERMREADEDES